MNVLDPIGRPAVERRALAPRPPALSGLTLGLLDNSKPNARVLLEGVAAELAARAGVAAVRSWAKPGSSTGATSAVLDAIARECQIVLTASAD